MNIILERVLIAWFMAQSIKFIIILFTQKRLEFSRLVGAGGMPSAHSSLVSALTTSVGLQEGFHSTIFVISLVFSLIVMYDAAGVRHAAGIQATILNQIVEDFYQNQKISEKKLKELLGHTPVEVIAGMVLGIAVALL